MLTDSHILFVWSIQKPKCKKTAIWPFTSVCVPEYPQLGIFYKFLHQSKYTQDLTVDKWLIELMDFLNEVSLKA